MGTNDVGIDDDALAREAAQLEIPPELESPAAPDPAASPDGAAPVADGSRELTEAEAAAIAEKHRPLVGVVVNSVADSLLPAWQITAQERASLTGALSVALAHWWPDGTVPAKWASLAGVLFVGYGIVNARRDANGKLRPRAIVTVSTGAASVAPSEARQDGTGGFSTAG